MEHSITEHCDPILLNQLETAKAELDELYNYNTEGSILRSKVRWFEHGEKSSKYFLGLEKRNKSKTHVQKLLANPHSSEEITEFNEVQKELKRFYKNLYTKQSLKTEKECLEYLSKLNAPKLSESDRSICEGKLTLNECWLALSSMKNGKSPGNDGLTKEFYVCFFEELGWLVCKTLNFSFDNGELSASEKQAVITLIEKKDCDKRLVKNWRPISLINVDCKIASKALASRLKKVIPQIIHYDQTAYVQGRNIGESVRLIGDLIDHADKENLDGMLFAADIEKAFDSLEHNFLYATLVKFGFGPDFIRWIRVLFFDAKSCVMNNGFSTGYFNLCRGTKQGDPLSPYLFILAVEVLFIQVRDDKSIRGFKIGDLVIKLAAFADDTTFFVKDKQSLNRILRLMANFEVFSSLKANIEKCKVCWLGKSKYRGDKPGNCKLISLVTGSIKILGVHFSLDKTLSRDKNFSDLLVEMRAITKTWKIRNLTFEGKVKIFSDR